MTRLQEKRNHARYDCKGPMILRYTHMAARQIEAGLLNFSEQGIRFASKHPLMPGTTIIVHASADNYRRMPAGVACQLRSIGLVTIKWCRESSRKGRPIHEMGGVYMMTE